MPSDYKLTDNKLKALNDSYKEMQNYHGAAQRAQQQKQKKTKRFHKGMQNYCRESKTEMQNNQKEVPGVPRISSHGRAGAPWTEATVLKNKVYVFKLD